MIPRILVPRDVRPPKPGEPRPVPRRLETYMDERTVIPAGLSEAPPLDAHTNIPAHMPLDVLVNRTLVPRGMPIKHMERPEGTQESYTSVAVLEDSRVVVPAQVERASAEEIEQFEHAPELTANLREVIEPDLFITGDANLLMEPTAKTDAKWDLFTRVASVLVHIGLIIFLIFTPKIFPSHTPTADEIALAKKELNFVYLPPETPSPPRVNPPMRMTPQILKKVAPPVEQPKIEAPPVQQQPKPQDLPEAPKPQTQIAPTQPQSQQPPQPSIAKLEPLQPLKPQPNSHLNLQIPSASPGRDIQDQLQDAIKHAPGQSGVYDGGQGRPGVGGPGVGQGYQILSDTQGVDFSNYINRLLATLRRNWEPLIPTSAQLGEKGVVFTTFSINPDGSVSSPDPTLERTSGKEPLDNAAMGAIHASNPFEPLPSQFHGPFLKLRIIFLYNIRPEDLNLH
jgi:outer membrane biosynthesis protein TonB